MEPDISPLSSSNLSDPKLNEIFADPLGQDREKSPIGKNDRSKTDQIVDEIGMIHFTRLHCSEKISDRFLAAKKIQRFFHRLRVSNERINRYIEKHFDVVSNVSSINSAKVIYFGESHTKDCDALRIAWVIDQLFKPGDRVLVEDIAMQAPCMKRENTLYAEGQIRFVNKDVELWTWDEKPKQHSIIFRNTVVLDRLASSLDQRFGLDKSDKKKLKTFDDILKLFNLFHFKDQLSFYLEDPILIERCRQGYKKEFIELLLINCIQIELANFRKMVSESFSQRQSVLVSRVSQELHERGRACDPERGRACDPAILCFKLF